MTGELGHLLLMLALVAAGVQALAGLLATPQPRLAAVALGWQTAGLLGAIGALAWAFVQHDFSLPSPAIDPAGEVVLSESECTTMATGDQFVSDDADRARISALGAKLVDMEGYAYASVCERFGVPLQIFKVPSDFADSETTMADWDAIVVEKSHQLRGFWDRLTA